MLLIAAGYSAGDYSILFLFQGILAGGMCYLDVAGVLLLLLGLGVIFNFGRECFRLRKVIIKTALVVFGFVIGFLACLFADASLCARGFGEVFEAWGKLYRAEAFHLPVTVAESVSVLESFLLILGMALGIYGFWRDKKRDYMGVYTVCVCLILAGSCYGVFTDEMPGSLYLFLFFAIMAGISVEECLRPMPERIEGLAQEMDGEAEKTDGKEEESESIAEGFDREAEGLEGKAEEINRKVKLIENPLPLPKKHVKRTMDYSIKTVGEDDDFDIKIAEEDDFDL